MRGSIVVFAAAVQAISITSPTKDTAVALGSDSLTVTWQRVDSDPTTAHIVLVNQMSGHTQYNKDLGSVDLTTGSYTIKPIDGISADSGYQVNIASVTTGNTGILAQSANFNITESNSSSSSSSPSSSSSASETSTNTATSGVSSQVAVATGSSTTSSGSATKTGSSSTTLSTATSSATGTAAGSSNNGTATTSGSTVTATSAGHRLAGGSVLALAIMAGTALLA